MSNGVDRRLKPVERVVIKSAACIVTGSIEGHAGLIRVTEKIQALEIHLLGAIGSKRLCCSADRRSRVDHDIVEVEAEGVCRKRRIAHLDHRGGSSLEK